MKYPFYTISQPVVGSEAKKIADAIKTGGYIANEAAIATAKRIAERRKLREETDATKR
ncbi:MAG TPA: hypothetical protein V6D28_15565 [Leptolyngbyaceae cyanobacterium]|uniref:hypothetical protein n=1 Tax=Argonema galeatum TaxID=2942762 RepID=UPI002010F06E|nr:hypothetical protein [Argonema galeatum]MCL1464851.1 hypothetical protein [Argonema galeatum A003/A1]